MDLKNRRKSRERSNSRCVVILMEKFSLLVKQNKVKVLYDYRICCSHAIGESCMTQSNSSKIPDKAS